MSVPEDSTYIQTISDIESFFSKPGRYHTTSSDQAYAVASALSWNPQIRLGQSLSVPEGEILFFESLGRGIKPNEMESWGVERDYYERRLQNYDRWELVWWREVIQNARDARGPGAPNGPSRIDLECEPSIYVDPDTGEKVDAIRCVCRDNGTGMDGDTLRKAFFTRGGTVKPAGAVGGFGDAKELILTPWLGYTVRSRDVMASGRHEGIFKPGITKSPEFIQGTEVTVWMSLTKTTTAEYAQLLVERCNLPGIRVTMNGKKLDSSLTGGTIVATRPIVDSMGGRLGELKIYHQPRAHRHGVYVRANGVFMFELNEFAGAKGVVYVDIFAPPRRVFTMKRDQLSGESSARNEVYAFLRELAVDPKSRLKKERAERNKINRIYKGTGAIEVREGIAADVAAAVAEKVGSKIVAKKPKKGEGITMDDEVVEAAVDLIGRLPPEAKGDADPVDLASTPEAVGIILRAVQLIEVEQVTSAIRFAAWKPDFFVHQELDTWHMPKKLEPGSMQAKYVKLARLWAELCKFALIQVGMFRPFGVGWVFDTTVDDNGTVSTVLGEYNKIDGRDWLLVRPVKLGVVSGDGEETYEEEGDAYDLASDMDIESLCATVIHEVTHMQGFSRHDQSYAAQLTKNIRIALRGMKGVAKRILKSVATDVREQFAEAREHKSEIKDTIAKAGAQGLRWVFVGHGQWNAYNDQREQGERYRVFDIRGTIKGVELTDYMTDGYTYWSTIDEAKHVAAQRFLKAKGGERTSGLPPKFYISGLDDPYFPAFFLLYLAGYASPGTSTITVERAKQWAIDHVESLYNEARRHGTTLDRMLAAELSNWKLAFRGGPRRTISLPELKIIGEAAQLAWKTFKLDFAEQSHRRADVGLEGTGIVEFTPEEIEQLVKAVDFKYDVSPLFRELPE